MQVNHVTDHVTHAVIGNNVAREAQISSSAEFYNMLSSTLYSNKPLAVVREVLCNAWDMHIQQGITDKPVEITLTKDKMVIRDFGTGIHDDNIITVYLTYGNSTKKLDGTQTGGFGLGSKAPWAYVDHFEVTSFHEGKKTIYAMSKSSGEVAGKPSALPIISVPTTETGLQVSIDMKSFHDSDTFEEYIRMIAEFGEMNVLLNGVKLDTVAFSQAEHGFILVKRNRVANVPGGDKSRIFVRYGNVVYPVPENHSLNERAVVNRINDLGGDYYSSTQQYNIILQAQPNTISVTPSRESLSMTERTIESLKGLFDSFNSIYDKRMEQECLINLESGIASRWIAGRPADLLTSNNEIPHLFENDEYGRRRAKTERLDIITDIKEAANAHMAHKYPSFNDFNYKDTLMRLDALQASGFGNRGKIQSFRREVVAQHKTKTPLRYNRRTGVGVSDWFQRVIVQPLMRKMDQSEEVSSSKLLVRAKHWSEKQHWGDGISIVEANKLSPRGLMDYMPFLRNFVVISFNRMDIVDRLPSYPVMKHWLGKGEDMFVYIVPRTTGKAENAKAFFESIGMTVVDLTRRQSWEPEEVLQPVAKPAVQKPRKKGLPLLGGIMNDKGTIHHSRIVSQEDFPRIEKPEFLVKFNPRVQTLPRDALIPGLTSDSVLDIIKLYGAKGGVVVNDNQYARFSAMGIPSLRDWLIRHISDEIQTNPALQTAFATRKGALPDSLQGNMRYESLGALRVIMSNPDLAKEFGFTTTLTDEDKAILRIYEDMATTYQYQTNADFKLAIEHVKKVPVDIKYLLLANKINDSRLVNSVNFSQIESKLKSYASLPQLNERQKKHKQGMIDILLYALEG